MVFIYEVLKEIIKLLKNVKVKKLISLTQSRTSRRLPSYFPSFFGFPGLLSAKENLIKQLLMVFLLRLIIVKKVLKLESK